MILVYFTVDTMDIFLLFFFFLFLCVSIYVFFLKIYLLICFWLCCLCCCTQAFWSCGKQMLLFIGVRGLLTAVVSLVAWALDMWPSADAPGFSSCGSQALECWLSSYGTCA